jgi:hypothetical protein
MASSRDLRVDVAGVHGAGVTAAAAAASATPAAPAVPACAADATSVRWPRGLLAASGPWVFAPRLPISRPARPRHAYTATPTPISCRDGVGAADLADAGAAGQMVQAPMCRHRCRRTCRTAGCAGRGRSHHRRADFGGGALRSWHAGAAGGCGPARYPGRRAGAGRRDGACGRLWKRRAAGILVRPRRPRRTGGPGVQLQRPGHPGALRWPARCAGTPTTSRGPRR